MKPIKHISFDFWNTLAISNPFYGFERDRILAEWCDNSEDHAKCRYKEVKRKIDLEVATGYYMPFGEAFARLAEELYIPPEHDKLHYETMVKAELWGAFYKFRPKILKATLESLETLKGKGYTLSIGSNTNFIPGRVIKDTFSKELEVFNFVHFSDELELVKPDSNFFAMIHGFVRFNNTGIEADEILHIGDSEVFDKKGAEKYGMKAMLVADPYELPQLLETL